LISYVNQSESEIKDWDVSFITNENSHFIIRHLLQLYIYVYNISRIKIRIMESYPASPTSIISDDVYPFYPTSLEYNYDLYESVQNACVSMLSGRKKKLKSKNLPQIPGNLLMRNLLKMVQ